MRLERLEYELINPTIQGHHAYISFHFDIKKDILRIDLNMKVGRQNDQESYRYCMRLTYCFALKELVYHNESEMIQNAIDLLSQDLVLLTYTFDEFIQSGERH